MKLPLSQVEIDAIVDGVTPFPHIYDLKVDDWRRVASGLKLRRNHGMHKNELWDRIRVILMENAR